MQEHARTSYEVSCDTCHVTFPIGTKQCMHCGRRLPRRGGQSNTPRTRFENTELAEIFEPGESGSGGTADEPTSGRSRLPFSPMTLLWVVVIAGSLAQRACQSG